MLSPTSIARFVTTRRTDQLLEAVIANGQYLPVVIKVWLSQVGIVPAISLGLKRVVELSRRPTPAAQMLTDALLAAQADDGGFEQDPLASALAAAALFQLMHDHHTSDPQVHRAHLLALEYLASSQASDGLFYDASELDPQRRSVFAAYILQLLARDPAARMQLKLDNLLQTLDLHSRSSTEDTSAHMLRDMQSFIRIARAGLPRTSAAVAA